MADAVECHLGDRAAVGRVFAEHVAGLGHHQLGGGVTLAGARAFLQGLGEGGAVMIKAVAGGGGRGMRPARSESELAEAFERCASEAAAAFGDGSLYVEAEYPVVACSDWQTVRDGRAGQVFYQLLRRTQHDGA